MRRYSPELRNKHLTSASAGKAIFSLWRAEQGLESPRCPRRLESFGHALNDACFHRPKLSAGNGRRCEAGIGTRGSTLRGRISRRPGCNGCKQQQPPTRHIANQHRFGVRACHKRRLRAVQPCRKHRNDGHGIVRPTGSVAATPKILGTSPRRCCVGCSNRPAPCGAAQRHIHPAPASPKLRGSAKLWTIPAKWAKLRFWTVLIVIFRPLHRRGLRIRVTNHGFFRRQPHALTVFAAANYHVAFPLIRRHS
jgi:hypothetical protein